jgi:ATP-dependent exoDNAse (exonuclease V) beta subunit
VRIDVVSASAGTGKTFRLARDLVAALLDGSVRPEGVVAVTYTTRAAGELRSRIRSALLREGEADLAARIRDGYIGTIHAVCERILREFALEAGQSPFLAPIPDVERKRLFDLALAQVVAGREARLAELARRLSIEDWREALRAIVDRARENGMDASALARSAAASRAGLERVLPPAVRAGEEHDARLLEALGPLVRHLDAAAGESKAARERASRASALLADARLFGRPAWKDQVQLAAALGAKKLAAAAGGFRELVAEHDACRGFQDDLLAMQGALFDLAARAMDAFAAEKARARVVDFGDMLALAHGLLDRSDVADALRARLHLVLVDEFQDTSPIQLAVVTRLGALARRSIWVGDRKQAIFAFQGSDPDLMTAAMDAALAGRAPDILGTSYRSRPPLVGAVSELFAPAFALHGVPPEQVRVAPAAPDPLALAGQPALEAWRWSPAKVDRGGGRSCATEAAAVAEGIEALLASPPVVRERVDGAADRLRPAARRDVAVLAFTNDVCRRIAAALRTRGIPARVALSGLTGTPEAVLARAALALLADPEDGVAAIEVSWLGGGAAGDPDGWLSRRLEEVAAWRSARAAAERSGGPAPAPPRAFEGDPRVAALRGAGGEIATLAPAEAVDAALRIAAIPELVRSWPDPEQRLANLEALRGQARAYEQLCAARRAPGTVLGLVAHLSALEDEAEQAPPTVDDAVTVSTWWSAKGLEWPVVILADLDRDRSRGPFEPAVEPAEAFRFEAPLAGRWVRWWPWPYGGMSKGLALADRAARSPEALRAADRDRREALRLLYVGFTRPRDLLVVVARCDGDGAHLSALEPLADASGAPRLSLPLDEQPGPARAGVGGASWPCTVRALSGLPPEAAPPAPPPARWYAPGERAGRPPERVNPSSEPSPAPGTAAGAVSAIGPRAEVRAGDLAAVGDAVHAFLAADAPGPPGERLRMASRLLAGHDVAGALAPETLLDASDALRAALDARHPGATWRREWPVRARLATDPPRLLVGEVDLFLELPDGFVLVDHKTFAGRAGERDRRVAEEWGPQLAWYAAALRPALRKPLRAAYVHLPLRGELIEVRLP